MSNVLFVSFRNAMLGTGTRVDLDGDTIRAMLIDHADDVPAPLTDDFIDDIAAGARTPAIASCPALATKTIGTVAAGVFDADDAVFTALSGDQCESLILFKDSGVEGTSALIAYWDSVTGIPLTPNGGDVNVVFSASGIIAV